MHNESMAEKIMEGTLSENGNDVLGAGETGIKFAKDESGVKFGVRFSNKQLFIGVAALTAGVLLKRYGVRGPVAQSASKIQDVAEQAEEAATRG